MRSLRLGHVESPLNYEKSKIGSYGKELSHVDL